MYVISLWLVSSSQGSCELPRLNTTALAAALGSGAWPVSPAEDPVTPVPPAPGPALVAVEACEGFPDMGKPWENHRKMVVQW